MTRHPAVAEALPNALEEDDGSGEHACWGVGGQLLFWLAFVCLTSCLGESFCCYVFDPLLCGHSSLVTSPAPFFNTLWWDPPSRTVCKRQKASGLHASCSCLAANTALAQTAADLCWQALLGQTSVHGPLQTAHLTTAGPTSAAHVQSHAGINSTTSDGAPSVGLSDPKARVHLPNLCAGNFLSHTISDLTEMRLNEAFESAPSVSLSDLDEYEQVSRLPAAAAQESCPHLPCSCSMHAISTLAEQRTALCTYLWASEPHAWRWVLRRLCLYTA